MAISKSVLMPSGVSATYWKITHVDIDVQGLTSSYTVTPFLNSTIAANRGRAVGSSKMYTFALVEANLLVGGIDAVYSAILSKAASIVPNIMDNGTHMYDPDIAGGTLV